MPPRITQQSTDEELRQALLERLLQNLSNPASAGMVRTPGPGGSEAMMPMPPLPPGSFNPNSPASIERMANTTRSPFQHLGGQPGGAAGGAYRHAGLAAGAMNLSDPRAGPGYGESNRLNPFGEGRVTQGGMATGDAGKQKNPLQQIGKVITDLVSILIGK